MKWVKNKHGFTIVELLIVVVVIAILAAITVVSYRGITNSAYDSSVKTDLANMAKQYEIYKINSGTGSYPYGLDLNDGLAFTIGVSKNSYDLTSNYQLLSCTNSTSLGSDYAILALSKSGKRFYISSTSGGVRESAVDANPWVRTTTCPLVLSGSMAHGAGFASAEIGSSPRNGWRPFIK